MTDDADIDRLRRECSALAGELRGCDPSLVTVETRGADQPHAVAWYLGLAVSRGYGDTVKAALVSLRDRLVDACDDRAAELSAEMRRHAAAAEDCRRRADRLALMVIVAREFGGAR